MSDSKTYVRVGWCSRTGVPNWKSRWLLQCQCKNRPDMAYPRDLLFPRTNELEDCQLGYGHVWCILVCSSWHFPRDFSIFKSWDFWTSLVPGPRDHRTFKVSRSCPVLSRDLEPLVPGLPRTSRDLFGKLFEKKKSIQKYMFFYFGKFFLLAKLLIFDCEP